MFPKAHNLDEKERTNDVLIEEQLNFSSLLLSDTTLQGLQNSGFCKPSPIQLKAIPIGKCGFDLIVKSKSGTGKTVVFTVIALELINTAKCVVQVLVVAPTREIAVQIQDVMQTIGSYYKGLRVESFIGGLPVEDDIKKLSKCHIAVGAPGRLKHLLEMGALKTTSLKLFVMDEADKLMDDNFEKDISDIFKKLPSVKQTIALSATYPEKLAAYLQKFMASPTHVTSEINTPLLLGLKQFVSVVKCNLNVIHQMNIKIEELVRILSKISFTQCLIFSNYQTRAESISNTLNRKGWSSTFISGAQNQLQRLEAINSLRECKCRILLSTDLTARGIDAPNVDLVINYDVPHDACIYLHRMGRAGRYGSQGVCITIAAVGKELTDLQNILGFIGGTTLSIAKIPTDDNIPNDLWNSDVSTFELLNGTVDNNDKHAKVNTDISNIINKLKSHQTTSKCENTNDVLENVNDNTCSIQNMLDINKANEEKVESTFSNVETFSLLNSLASGEQCNKLNNSIAVDENLLINLGDEVKTDSKKRKRRNGTYEKTSINISDKKKTDYLQNTIAIKNIALLHITKLLFSKYDISKIPEDVIEAIDAYIKILKQQECSIIEKHMKYFASKNPCDVISLLTTSDLRTSETYLLDENESNSSASVESLNVKSPLQSSQMEEQNLPYNDIEQIFKFGFDYAIKSNAPHWLDVLDEKFKENMNFDDDHENLKHSDENVSDDTQFLYKNNDEPKSKKKHHKGIKHRDNYKRHKVLREDKIKETENSNENYCTTAIDYTNQSYVDYERFPGLYSEYEYSNNEHFISCFNHYSNELCKHGLTFEDTASFESWFSQWQWHVQGVRDYIQQNIYLQEMQKYTCMKK